MKAAAHCDSLRHECWEPVGIVISLLGTLKPAPISVRVLPRSTGVLVSQVPVV